MEQSEAQIQLIQAKVKALHLDAAEVELVQRIRDGETILSSVRSVIQAVALAHNVSEASLKTRLHRRNLGPADSSARLTLTSDEEMAVVGFVSALCSSLHLTLKDIAAIGTVTLQARDPSAPQLTHGWAQHFVLRHCINLRVRTLKPSDKGAKVGSLWMLLLEWNQRILQLLERHSYRRPLIFNCDETRAIPREQTVSATAPANWAEAHASCLPNSKLWTIFTVVGADGSVLYSVYIYKDTGCITGKKADLSKPDLVNDEEAWPIYFFRSESGFMVNSIWEFCLDKFIELVAPLRKDSEERVLLFADGAASHQKLATADKLEPNSIDICFFPANSRPFLQPLGDAPLASFKSQLSSKPHQTKVTAALMSVPVSSINLPHNAYTCERSALTPAAIQKGFEERGLFPYNFGKIMSNFRFAHPESSTPTTVANSMMTIAQDIFKHLLHPELVEGGTKINLESRQTQLMADDIRSDHHGKIEKEAAAEALRKSKLLLKAEKAREKEEKASAARLLKATKSAKPTTAAPSSGPQIPKLHECSKCKRSAGDSAYDFAQKLCTKCVQVASPASHPISIENVENAHPPVQPDSLTPPKDKSAAPQPETSLPKEPTILSSTMCSGSTDCSKCSEKLNEQSGRVRCNLCSGVMYCTGCVAGGSLEEHSAVAHPNQRAPSSRRLKKLA